MLKTDIFQDLKGICKGNILVLNIITLYLKKKSVFHHCFLIIIGLYVKWKLNGANWDLFKTLCTCKLVPENFKKSSDPKADSTSSLIEISKQCIPQTSTNPTKSNP